MMGQDARHNGDQCHHFRPDALDGRGSDGPKLTLNLGDRSRDLAADLSRGASPGVLAAALSVRSQTGSSIKNDP
jgi:hypothetical protein